MCKKIVSIVIFITLASCVSGAIRKSWKSPANFEEEIPKFTPFDSEEIVAENGGGSGEKFKTTETTTTPSPSPATLTNQKISSRIKMPEKYVADIYSTLTKDSANKISNDFGAFNFETSPSEEDDDQFIPTNKLANKNDNANNIDSNTSSEQEKTDEEEFDDDLEIMANDDATQYKVGQLLNVTVDPDENTVNVNVDQQTLKDLFTGRGNKRLMIFVF